MVKRLTDIEPSQRPRERLFASGPAALSDAEVLAVLMRTGRRGHSVVAEAHELLKEAGGLAGMARMDVKELMARPGMGPAKTSALAAGLELGRRLAKDEYKKAPGLGQPDAAGEYLIRHLNGRRREVFGFISLDCRHRLIAVHDLFQGTRNQTPVEVSQLFREALLDDASALLIFHNHPSGDLDPSANDLAITGRLVEGGRLVGVSVLDHLVIGASKWRSLRSTHPDLFSGPGLL